MTLSGSDEPKLGRNLSLEMASKRARVSAIKLFLVSSLLVLLFSSLSCIIPSKASIIWSDNFDDGDLDGWTLSGASWFAYKGSKLGAGNFSVADKTLRVTGVEKYMALSFSSHPKMTATGTWSWDLYFNPEGTMIGKTAAIDFVDTPIMELPFDWSGYSIDITNMGDFTFWRIEDGTYAQVIASGFKSNQGSWVHMDMTYDSNGRWCLYVNDTLKVDVVDKKVSDFSYFGFWLVQGPAIDNVVVSDTVYVPPGSLRVNVKDSSGNALTGAAVSSTKKPDEQTALSGTTATNGTITFTGLAVGNYTLQISKNGHVSGLAQGVVVSGAKTELSSTLQAQPSSGIPGFPDEAIIIGALLCTIWLFFKSHLKQH
jgi:hypothetical protein